jgi:hypothetical protein
LSLTAEQRRLRAQKAAHARWARPGARAEHGVKSSAARIRRYEDEVDPDRVLTADERAKCVESALQRDMKDLAFLSSKARAARKAG